MLEDGGVEEGGEDGAAAAELQPHIRHAQQGRDPRLEAVRLLKPARGGSEIVCLVGGNTVAQLLGAGVIGGVCRCRAGWFVEQ